MTFVRNKEDFTCEHCGTAVVGTGYTNHCPKCLWSKHVDIDPGDRAADCGGMMAPIAIEGSTGKGYMVRQKCQQCGFERRNSVMQNDAVDTVLALIKTKTG